MRSATAGNEPGNNGTGDGSVQPPAHPAASVVPGQDKRDKFRAGAEKMIMVRLGRESDETANEYRHFSLFELAKESLTLAGVDFRGLDRHGVISAAFQPGGDFPGLVENIAVKEVLRGYEETEEPYRTLARIGNLPDFKVGSRTGLSHAPSLPENIENEEVQTIRMQDRKQNIQLATYAGKVGLSRQAIINDDLGEFGRVAMRVGGGARRTVGDRFANVFTQDANGQTIDEGSARIFAAARNNTGTAGAPSTATFDEFRTLMAVQTDVSGSAKNLNIMPSYIYCPHAKAGAARKVVDSEFDVGGSEDRTTPNTERGRWQGVIADSRLDAVSTDRYYALADPNRFDTVEVAFLDGQDAPTIQRVEMFDVLGINFVVWIDCVAQALEFRTMAVNDGA